MKLGILSGYRKYFALGFCNIEESCYFRLLEIINMQTTQFQIEAKIQEIREASKYPYTYFKNREDLSDMEWMIRELKNSQLIYKIVAIPTASFCAFLIIYIIGMVLEIFKIRNIESNN